MEQAQPQDFENIKALAAMLMTLTMMVLFFIGGTVRGNRKMLKQIHDKLGIKEEG